MSVVSMCKKAALRRIWRTSPGAASESSTWEPRATMMMSQSQPSARFEGAHARSDTTRLLSAAMDTIIGDRRGGGNMNKAMAVLAALFLVSGCATVTRSTKDAWVVDSLPQGAKVMLSDGKECVSTPCGIRVSRRSDFVATLYKRGYKPAQVQVTHSMGNGGGTAITGNAIICCGVVGWAVDAIDGAGLKLTPNPVLIRLEPEDIAKPPPAPQARLEPRRLRGPCIRVPTDPSQSTC